ncbi:MAG: hypothetical protein GY788_28440 [bacterium]|nr:hypothetical protein [bacterium]
MDVTPPPGAKSAVAASGNATPVDKIIVTEDDITDRPYRVLADLEVTVSKPGLLDSDPTPEMIDDALKEEAGKLGADAVVLVRYGTVGVGVWSWGELEGRGRAVQFVDE